MKLAEIKAILAGNPTEEQLTELKKDERAGVQKLLAAYDKKREKEKQERLRFANMLRYRPGPAGWSVGHCGGHFAGGRVYRRAERQQKAQ